MSGRVGRHERALRDHSFPVASQRFENAMRQPRSIPQAGQLLRHLRMEQDNTSVFDLFIGDSDCAVAGLSMFDDRMDGVLLTPRSTSRYFNVAR